MKMFISDLYKLRPFGGRAEIRRESAIGFYRSFRTDQKKIHHGDTESTEKRRRRKSGIKLNMDAQDKQDHSFWFSSCASCVSMFKFFSVLSVSPW
jgi:hypothetical protein